MIFPAFFRSSFDVFRAINSKDSNNNYLELVLFEKLKNRASRKNIAV